MSNEINKNTINNRGQSVNKGNMAHINPNLASKDSQGGRPPWGDEERRFYPKTIMKNYLCKH